MPKVTAYDAFGRFFVGHVAPTENASRRQKRRVLCFATHDGVVGASLGFNHKEAFDRARAAQAGNLPLPQATNADGFFTTLLSVRGFPIRSSDDCVDEETATLLQKEFVK